MSACVYLHYSNTALAMTIVALHSRMGLCTLHHRDQLLLAVALLYPDGTLQNAVSIAT